MNIHAAIANLAAGKSVRRALWLDTVYLKVVTFNGFAPTVVTYGLETHDSLIKPIPGDSFDWDDCLATDWELFE